MEQPLANEDPVRYVCIYADQAGVSYVEDVDIALSPIPGDLSTPPALVSAFTPAEQYTFVRCPPSTTGAWQTAPRRQSLFLMVGEAEIEVGDGELRRFGPRRVVLLDDTSGGAHNGRFVGPDDALLVLLELPGSLRSVGTESATPGGTR